MFLALLSFGSLCVAPVSREGGPVQPTVATPSANADSLATLYASGRTWAEFLDGVRARRTLWLDNHGTGSLDDQLVDRAKAVGGAWRFLVVAVDSCSDSANTIPYLARLVEAVPGLELRIVNPVDGRWVMESHRTADDRAATPTVLLLDATYRERGCFVERPAALRALLAESGLTDQERYERKMEWYREDRGMATVRDLVELLEGAAAGAPVCDARR